MHVRIEYYNREVEELDNVSMIFKLDHRIDCKNGDISIVHGDVINFRISSGEDKIVPLKDIEHLSIYQAEPLSFNEQELALIKSALKHDIFEEERKETHYRLYGEEESEASCYATRQDMIKLLKKIEG